MPTKAANKELDESLLQTFTDKLQENRDKQEARHEIITEALRSITDQLAGMNTFPPQPPDPLLRFYLSHDPSNPILNPNNLELPPHDGLEPLYWLFQAEQFFQFYQVSPNQRLQMVAFYMKGAALN
ncbi:unnamed protein product [Lupinus luteus]|uniref:Uncharacterized protein n=1 Tax=Lupinus luteus TaxID=3873 RepID=A0AAV1Y2T4_LUPLU